MSKYNEFHLCAIEEIKKGKYYHLRKKHSPKKYGGEGKVLQKVLAQHYGLNQNKICVFDNGSSEGLAEIIKIYGQGQKILIEAPTYGPIYETALKTDKNLIIHEHEKQPQRDLAKLAERLNTDKPGLVIFCNPGNPFGQFTKPEELYEFCKVYPEINFLIDEAYLDFYEVKENRIINYNDLPPNILCLRTFSKMHGLAGLRIGYAISSRKHIKKIESFPFMKFLIPEAEFSAAHSIDKYKVYTEKFIRPVIKDNLKLIEKYKEYFGAENIFCPEAPNMVLIKLPDFCKEKTKLLDIYLRTLGRIYINIFGRGSDFESNKIGFGDQTYLRISLLDKKTNENVFKKLIKAIEFIKSF